MVNWNVLVKSRDNAKAARKLLAETLLPENPDCLNSTDLDFIGEQDYIAALPIELALSVKDRANLRLSNPEIRWIITGVREEDVTNLVANYGYKVLEPEREKPIKDQSENVASKSYFSINGKEVTEEEFEEKLEKIVRKVIGLTKDSFFF